MNLLISDLHLHEQRPDITRAFVHFLATDARQAEALYILGDFFEVWIGDDGMSPYQHSIAQALRELSANGTRIYLMHGNRDFLIGQRFCQEADCTLLRDPHIAQLGTHRVLLMHGDSLCTQDVNYMKLRRWLRNPVSLFILRNLPLRTRQKLASKLRNESRAQTQMKAQDIIDVTPAEVDAIMRQYGVTTLIHGHTHRPATHQFMLDGKPAQRIVLGDWDAQGWTLEVNDSGFKQRSFAIER